MPPTSTARTARPTSCSRTRTGARDFRSDPSVIGRTVEVNRQPYTIVGVTPPEFRGTLLFFPPDFFVPIVNHDQLNSEQVMNVRGDRWVMKCSAM